MIVLDLNVDVLGNTRFAFSPLSELACSVAALTCAGRSDPHAAWARWARPRVGHVDVPLLQAVHPPGRWAPDFLFPDVDGPDVSLPDQLDALAEVDDGEVEKELAGVWDQRPLPDVARRALDGPLRFGEVLATELRTYWDAALAPHWPRVRGALEEDVAHRAGQTLRGGLFDLLADLHHEVSVDGAVLRIDKPHHDDVRYEGARLTLVPAVFIWPHLLLAHSSPGAFQLTYPARGVGRLWEGIAGERTPRDDLGSLLGRTRATVLTSLAAPMSTTSLSRELGQSPATISQHLAVLRECGMVRSWRSGRSVLYQQTALAASLVGAARH